MKKLLKKIFGKFNSIAELERKNKELKLQLEAGNIEIAMINDQIENVDRGSWEDLFITFIICNGWDLEILLIPRHKSNRYQGWLINH